MNDALRVEFAQKLQGMKLSQIKELAKMLNARMDDAADLAFDFVLDVLMAAMPEDEFIEFCDGM